MKRWTAKNKHADRVIKWKLQQTSLARMSTFVVTLHCMSGLLSSLLGGFISFFHGWESLEIGSSIPPLGAKASSTSSVGATPFVLVNWAFSNLNKQAPQHHWSVCVCVCEELSQGLWFSKVCLCVIVCSSVLFVCLCGRAGGHMVRFWRYFTWEW